MRKILIIISVLGGFSLQTLAQKIGLDEAIDFALKNNLELKVADKEVQHKEAFVATSQEIPNIETLITDSLNTLPKIFPAIKRGQQVKTQFKLPIILRVN